MLNEHNLPAICVYTIREGSYEIGVCMPGGTLFHFFPGGTSFASFAGDVRRQVDIVTECFGNHPSGNNLSYIADAIPVHSPDRAGTTTLNRHEKKLLIGYMK